MPIKTGSESEMMVVVLGLGIVIISFLFAISLYFIKKHLSKNDDIGDKMNDLLLKFAQHEEHEKNLTDSVDALGEKFDYIDGRVQDLGKDLNRTYTKVAVLDERVNNFSQFQKILQGRD